MTPITINEKVSNKTIADLRESLNRKSYTFCVNADFTKEQAVHNLVVSLEMELMEGIMRILEDKYEFRPFQNKIYEKIEYTFDSQTAYNLNRAMSSLRRAKMFGIDATDDKYINWFKNRVKHGVKGLRDRLSAIDYELSIEKSEAMHA
jgi:ribosome-associated toxin RatA of RatAB toxin-antitoxin module